MASIHENPSHGGSSASSSCPQTPPLSSHATSNKEDGTSNNANNNEKKTYSHFLISKIDFPDNNTRIEYFTDLEGNWDYFLTLVERSSVVFYDNNNTDNDNDNINTLVQKFRLAPNTILVHGGDVVDKGPGDIRIVKILVHLKQTYPSRVFLLCGNRDVNKLRFTSELDDDEEKSSMTTAPIYWNPKHVPYADYLENKGLLNDDDGISKLKWMLECTMGSPTTFETRRRELEALQQQEDTTNSPISDQDVFNSFRDSVHPNSNDPWMLDYLRHGQLMLIIGDCLFVHGGIIEACLGQVPGQQENAGSLLDWCQNLNQFFAAMIQEFVNQPVWTKTTDRTRGGELLMDYGVPGGNHGATVVYNTFVENGNPQRPDSATIQYLREAGITRVFVGHQPTGDCPWVIRVDDNDNNIDINQKELSIFLCDTSYSDVQANKTTNPANNRGAAVSNVMITRHETITKGILANGKQHGFTMKTTRNTNKVITTQEEEKEQCDDSLGLPPTESTMTIGKQLLDGSWVKTILLLENDETNESNNNEKMTFVVGKGEGWKVETKEMDLAEVLLQLQQQQK